MFRKTLRKLTALNSIVFLILFIVFGGIVYSYIFFTLFVKVDDAMRQRAEVFRLANGRIVPQPRFRMGYDPRIFLLLKSTDGRIINLFPQQREDVSSDITAASIKVTTGSLESIEHEGHTYRVLNVPYQYEDRVLTVDRENIEIANVIVVSIVDSEMVLLNNLLIIIAAGLIIGTTVIILAGYYLARHALVPIQLAWDKQQQFVGDASHELRSPLTIIQSNAELMLRHPEHTVEAESKRVTNILREAMRMTKLVSTLLTLARADANQAEIRLAPVVLNEIIEVIAEQFKPLAELKGLQLTTDTNGTLEMLADKERLHQLLVILLDNAMKFTSAPGEITLVSYQKANQIHIKVKDTGCGIPEKDLPRVFDRFFRSDKARSREAGGTGLGLSIAQWIVEKHNGKITVDSEFGVGTEFRVMLPVKKVREA